MQTRSRISVGRPPFGRRAVTLAASAAATVAVGVGSAFVASLIASAADGGSTPTDTSAASCDTDGVTVGYDVRYAASIGGYAVSGVRVLDIASACAGGPITVALGGPTGDPLPGATLSGTIGGSSLRLPVSDTVAAASISRVYVTLAGQTTIADPPAQPVTTTAPTTTAPAPTPTPTPALPVAPSLCPTIGGATVVVGAPEQCGSVAAAPSVTAAVQKPTPVASWPAQVFPDKVKVTLETPPEAELKVVSAAPSAVFVRLSIVRESTGEPITRWEGVMAIDFPAQPGPFLSAYSEDGQSWHTIPQLDGPNLPAGQADGYFQHSDRTVTVYTRHATFFALAPPPAKVAKVHAKLLPTGAVRVTWTPSEAGLGVASYWLVRDGRVIRKLDGTATRTILGGLRPARLSLRVIAVDPIGTRSDTSAAAAVLVPLLVGARVERVGPVLRAHVRLLEPARLRALVLDADGRRLTELGLGSRPAGDQTLALRVAAGRLRPGGRYRVVVLATPARGRGDRAEIRFRG